MSEKLEDNSAGKSLNMGGMMRAFGCTILLLFLSSCDRMGLNETPGEPSGNNGIKSVETTEPTRQKNEKIAYGFGENFIKPEGIKSTREYKIYKLGLGSIVSIKGDIEKAKVKISNIPELSNILDRNDIKFETIMPSIIKESKMDNSAKSTSGAVGYFQLRPIAVDDVVNTYGIKGLGLDMEDPVDNIIIGILYRKILLERVKKRCNFSGSDLEKMMILSYNVGPERVKNLFKESKTNNYNGFQEFLAKKIGVKGDPEKKIDKTYGVLYIDPLSNFNVDKLTNKVDEKIAEGLRYVAIIDGISRYFKSDENIEILGKIKCDENTTLFSVVKDLRNQGVFSRNAPINDICKIILETNGYSEKETPKSAELLIISEALENYLP